MALAQTGRKAAIMATAAVLATSRTTTHTVPHHLHLSSILASHDFTTTKLQPITLTTDPVSQSPLAKAGELLPANNVILKHVADGGGVGAVGFVVRRPGLCREEAHELTSIAAMDEAEGFGFFGIIKEIGVDDEGLTDFSTKFYPGRDLYLDEDLDFYKVLGDRRLPILSVLMSPLKSWKMIRDIGRRHEEKGIEQNMIGEGFVQGGVIVFDADGKPRYSYLEKTGEEIPTEDILAALKEVKASSGASEL